MAGTESRPRHRVGRLILINASPCVGGESIATAVGARRCRDPGGQPVFSGATRTGIAVKPDFAALLSDGRTALKSSLERNSNQSQSRRVAMTGAGKKHASGNHAEAGQKFHPDAKTKGESQADKQTASSAAAPAPGKTRAKAANGKFTKSPASGESAMADLHQSEGQQPDQELGANEVNNKKLGGSFENNGQVRHTSHDGARPGLEKGENADAA
jgi:hypothetical protein